MKCEVDMKHLVAYAITSIMCFGALIASTFAGEGNGDAFRLVSRLPDGWVIEYTPGAQPFTHVEINGKMHLLFDGMARLDASFDHTGLPKLPVEVVTLGIPADAFVQAELLDPEYELIAKQLVAPYPTYHFSEETEPVAEYRKDASAYGQNRFFPSLNHVADPPGRFRDQRIASIRISPYQYNPATETLRRIVRAKLHIRLMRSDGGGSMVLPPPSAVRPDPHFEELYRSTLFNYDEAKGWRVDVGAESFHRMVPDPTRDWFETGKNYYKIPVTEDAWYKVTKAQLVAAGANPSLIDIPTLKIFYRGVQIPVVVRPDTSVEFYGRRNYGDSTYTDFFTDTSAYWLTWGGVAGLRFTPSFVDSTGIITNLSSSLTMRHFEENNDYYQGTTTNDIINIHTIPGEGWAWGEPPDWFFPTATREYAFVVDEVAAGPVLQAGIRVRLVSTTLNYTTPNHRARFWVNDSLVGEVTFPGRTSVVFNATIPQSWLRSGTNQLRIQSILTLASPNQFYLDWFEVDYERRLRAGDNQLAVVAGQASQLTRTTFTASGFTNSQIEAFDLSTMRQITSAHITQDEDGYSIAFRDTLAVPRSYIVVGGGGARPVSSVTQKMFTDIRVNASGADYVVITHKNFLTAAQQLATHRQTVNGVRTKVILVDDIYDEFNYGIMNATKLKPFVKYAFDNWPQPKPAYLLLFGDASWDYHRFLSTSINTNFVPSYGVPVSDNWFVTFNPDTVSLPSMLVGRIPVATPAQAQSVVQKIVGYDSYTLAEWNKNFLFITGGNNLSEQSQFNAYSEGMISLIVAPPIGGTPFRVYKTTLGVIDGEHKGRLKQLVRDGLVFMNFIGHSGGRIWGVDIGPPSELENTNGKLPFLASVSCNVGGFADPESHVLAEDFVLADNRGSIAAWASSTLGYPSYGRDLGRDFLQGVRDSGRTFGLLTTNAKIKMLRTYGADYIANATVQTNNLLGDPLSRFALPLKPDLAIRQQDIIPSNPTPTVNDTLVMVKVKMFNYGLVTPDSVDVAVTDTYNGQTTTLANRRVAPMRQVDSINVEWRAMHQVGLHTLTASLDPQNLIPEVSELNNIASREQYVYANLLSVVKPVRNMVVGPGVQRLVVTSPFGVDSSGFAYEFQLDTVDTFDSPALIESGQIVPTAVTGEWLTPSLPVNRVYFWRARTSYANALGKWVESAFSTGGDVPALPQVRWRENSSKQFRRDILTQASATDSGVTIAPSPAINLFVRSVGYRYNQLAEYYSIIKINEQKITGYWWELGSSFMVIRLNEFTGAFDFRAFNLVTFPADSGLREAQRMADFINQTPVGNYVAWSVIFDGRTNVTESLYVAMESLGSTLARTVQPGQSWAFVGRKGSGGPGMTALEVLTNDTAVVSLQIPNYYSYGNGSIATERMFVSDSWSTFQWQQTGAPSTNTRLAILGNRPSGTVDTLGIFPKDSATIDLSFMNPLTSGERYNAVQVAALFSTTDALVTPSLHAWQMDLNAPADLAISARTLSSSEPTATRNVEVTVYNIGYQNSDSSTVVLSVYDRQNRARQLASVSVLPVALGSSRTVVIPISTTNLPRRVMLQAVVHPAKRAKDLVYENNTAYHSFDLGPSLMSAMQVYTNGSPVMEGDYVPATPVLMLDLQKRDENPATRIEAQLFVNNRLEGTWTSPAGGSEQRPTFNPQLSDGLHQLTFKVMSVNSFGEIDTTENVLNVLVSKESRILHMYNYPNPFSRDTYFTFMLAGSAPPEELRIRIFTVAGRKIRDILVPPSSVQIGSNRIHWDGRDEDGDEIANGYYFYQASLKGEGKELSAVQKLVKVR